MTELDKNDLILTMLKDMRHTLERHVDKTEESFAKAEQDRQKIREEMKDEFANVRQEMKDGFAEAEKDRQNMKEDTDTIKNRDFSWSSRLMAIMIAVILGLNTLISFIVAKIVVSGMKVAEVGGDIIVG